MSRWARIVLEAFLLAGSGCGFLDNARACNYYLDHCVPSNEAVLLGTWPVHVVALASCAVADQGLRTVAAVVPASRDAYDYLLLPVNDDNVMLHRTVIVPKVLATPLILVGSYAARWLFPVPAEERVFAGDDLTGDLRRPGRNPPRAEIPMALRGQLWGPMRTPGEGGKQ